MPEDAPQDRRFLGKGGDLIKTVKEYFSEENVIRDAIDRFMSMTVSDLRRTETYTPSMVNSVISEAFEEFDYDADVVLDLTVAELVTVVYSMRPFDADHRFDRTAHDMKNSHDKYLYCAQMFTSFIHNCMDEDTVLKMLTTIPVKRLFEVLYTEIPRTGKTLYSDLKKYFRLCGWDGCGCL